MYFPQIVFDWLIWHTNAQTHINVQISLMPDQLNFNLYHHRDMFTLCIYKNNVCTRRHSCRRYEIMNIANVQAFQIFIMFTFHLNALWIHIWLLQIEDHEYNRQTGRVQQWSILSDIERDCDQSTESLLNTWGKGVPIYFYGPINRDIWEKKLFKIVISELYYNFNSINTYICWEFFEKVSDFIIQKMGK